MKEVLVLKDLKQIKSISQSFRIKILETFKEQPATAKHISDLLCEPHGKVNYHIKALANVGILELVEETVKLGIVEKYYMPVAKSFVIDSGVMTPSNKKIVASIDRASHALFDMISKEFHSSLNTPEKKLSNKVIHKTDVYLTEEEARSLQAELEEVVTNFIKAKETSDENASKYFVSALLIPCENSAK